MFNLEIPTKPGPKAALSDRNALFGSETSPPFCATFPRTTQSPSAAITYIKAVPKRIKIRRTLNYVEDHGTEFPSTDLIRT